MLMTRQDDGVVLVLQTCVDTDGQVPHDLHRPQHDNESHLFPQIKLLTPFV